MHNELQDLLKSHGLSGAEADQAIANCSRAMMKGAAVSYFAGGVIMYFMNTNPASAFGYGTLALGVGAGKAFLSSDQCSRVRQAVDFWSTQTN